MKNKLLPLLILILGTITTLWLWKSILFNEKQSGIELFKAQTVSASELIKAELKSILTATQRMASRMSSGDDIDFEAWRTDAENYVKDFPGFLALQWADANGIVRKIVPLKGNEKAQEFDNMREPKRRKALLKAKESHLPYFTKPINLIQGGKGFLAFYPLWNKELFKGYLVGVFRYEELFPSLLREIPEHSILTFQSNNENIIEWGNKLSNTNKLSKHSHTLKLQVNGLEWNITLTPSAEYFKGKKTNLSSISLILGLILTSLLAITAYLYQLYRNRSKQYVSQLEKNEEVEKLFKSAFEAAPSGMLLVNKKGQITLINKELEKLFGYTEEEIIGKSIEFLIPDRFRDLHEGHMRSFMNYPAERSMGEGRSIWGLHKNKTELPLEIGLIPIKKNDSLFVLGSIIDITERQTHEEQLRQTNIATMNLLSDIDLERKKAVDAKAELEIVNNALKSKNQELNDFTSIASHDLQEPLRKITTFCSYLEEDIGGELPKDAKKDIEIIVDAANRMRQLIQDLLNLSRMGRKELEIHNISLNKCIDNALDALSTTINESKIKIVRHDTLPEEVIGDTTMLTQLYQNLIGNAVKFSHNKHPRVEITAEDTEHGWIFGVKDNGIGIKAEYREKIFQPFRRLHSREEFVGTGIGLAICSKVIERHGGKIWVESEPNKGSHFKFILSPKYL